MYERGVDPCDSCTVTSGADKTRMPTYLDNPRPCYWNPWHSLHTPRPCCPHRWQSLRAYVSSDVRAWRRPMRLIAPSRAEQTDTECLHTGDPQGNAVQTEGSRCVRMCPVMLEHGVDPCESCTVKCGADRHGMSTYRHAPRPCCIHRWRSLCMYVSSDVSAWRRSMRLMQSREMRRLTRKSTYRHCPRPCFQIRWRLLRM